MLGTTEETFPVVAPGAKFAMGFESGSAKFTDYEMTISVDMRDYGETNYVDQISAEHNDADGKVVAKLTNTAPETVNRLQAIAVFYNGDQVVGASYPSSEFDIAPGSSVTMERIAPYDGEKFEPLDYDRYEIFVNMAYTD